MQIQPREPLQQIMLARYYSSSLGRFMAVDPALKIEKNLSMPQRWNRYTYALNNPLKFVDPDGRDLTYADDNAKKQTEAARAVSPGTDRVLKRFEKGGDLESKKVTMKTGDAPDPKGEKRLGQTNSDYTKKDGTFTGATVIIDQKDIDVTGNDPRTAVIHEVVGHLEPNSGMSKDQAEALGEEGREKKAQELTAAELDKIPEDKRPKPITPPTPEKKDK